MRHFNGIQYLKDNEKPRQEKARRAARRFVTLIKRGLILGATAAMLAAVIGCGPRVTVKQARADSCIRYCDWAEDADRRGGGSGECVAGCLMAAPMIGGPLVGDYAIPPELWDDFKDHDQWLDDEEQCNLNREEYCFRPEMAGCSLEDRRGGFKYGINDKCFPAVYLIRCEIALDNNDRNAPAICGQ